MAKSTRPTKTDKVKSDTKPEPQPTARTSEPVAEPDLFEKPMERDWLGPRVEGDAVAETDISEEPRSGGISADGLDVDSLTVERSLDEPVAGLEEGFDPDDLDQFLDRVGDTGGADGRDAPSDGAKSNLDLLSKGAGGENEDRGVEDDLPDQTPELTELYGGLKIDDALGGDIDDNPNDDSAGSTYDGLPPLADPTDLVADYGSDYNETEPDTSAVSAQDAVPDEEFFET